MCDHFSGLGSDTQPFFVEVINYLTWKRACQDMGKLQQLGFGHG